MIAALAGFGCGVSDQNSVPASPESVIRRYAATVAEHKLALPANAATCTDVACVATVGTVLDEVAKTFRQLPAPPAKIKPLVQQTLNASDRHVVAFGRLVACSEDHAVSGSLDVDDCPTQFRSVQSVVLAWAKSLPVWDSYIR